MIENREDREFIEEHRPLVVSVASKIKRKLDLSTDMDELIAFGFAGLVEARERFDPAKNVQFSTFAYYRVRGAILDGVRKMAFLPRRAYQKLKAAEAADRVTEGIGETRAVDPASRADARRTAEALDGALGKLTASFVMSCVGQSEDDRPSEDPEGALLGRESAQRVRGLVAALPDRERALVEGFYFQGRRFDEVARELGISKSWASRLHTKALVRLKSGLEEG